MRATISVAPPGAYGTIILTGFAGYLFGACADAEPARRPTIAIARTASRFILDLPFAGARLCRLCSMQPVRGVLHGEKDDIACRTRLARMHHVGGDIEDRARPRLHILAADGGVEGALENVNPLLVGMRMRLRAGARRHAHQADDHAVTFDAGAVGGRIVGTAQDVIDLCEIEQVLARSSALGARRSGGGAGVDHRAFSSFATRS